MPKFLFDHGHGRYELYDLKKHGEWEGGYPKGKGPSSKRDLPSPEEGETVIGEANLSLERDLEEHLSKKLGLLEEGLRIGTFEGKQGRQFNTDVGRIDLLCRDASNKWVVIELKAEVATDRTLGQILRYMGWVKEQIAHGDEVRGMIVAHDFDNGARLAIRAANLPVELVRFSVEFQFDKYANLEGVARLAHST